MNDSTIGIKIANGTYYRILDAGSARARRLVLTTANDNQESVQIDLYEGNGEILDDARYVGSLLIDDLAPAAKGEAEIELTVRVDDGGALSALARDTVSGVSERLSVGLHTLGDEGLYDMPEFEFEDADDDQWAREAVGSDEGEPVGTEDELGIGAGLAAVAAPERGERRPWLVALLVLLGLAAVVALGLLVYQLLQGPAVPPLEARHNSAQTGVVANDANDTDTAGGESPALSGESPAAASRAEPSGGSERLVSSVSRQNGNGADAGGVWYWVRWGDTLWGISTSFYRTPWLYGDIAAENQIKNPDRIYAGARIFIPRR